MIVISHWEQLKPGIFEHALHHLNEHEPDL